MGQIILLRAYLSYIVHYARTTARIHILRCTYFIYIDILMQTAHRPARAETGIIRPRHLNQVVRRFSFSFLPGSFFSTLSHSLPFCFGCEWKHLKFLTVVENFTRDVKFLKPITFFFPHYFFNLPFQSRTFGGMLFSFISAARKFQKSGLSRRPRSPYYVYHYC